MWSKVYTLKCNGIDHYLQISEIMPKYPESLVQDIPVFALFFHSTGIDGRRIDSVQKHRMGESGDNANNVKTFT